MEWVVRRRYLVAGAVVVSVGAVAVIGLLRPKEWMAEATVLVDPLSVPGLYDTATPTETGSIIDREVEVAGGPRFRDAVLASFDHPVEYEVVGDSDAATLRFEVRSDSAARAFEAAFSIANGYVGYGRTLGPAARRDEAQLALDQAAAGADVAQLRSDVEAAQGALDRLAGGGGRIVTAPRVPDDPASPPLARWLVLATLLGVVIGLGLAWRLDRRRPVDTPYPDADRVPADQRERRARLVVGAVLVAVPGLLGAAVLAGYLSVWELRPAAADQEEQKYACLERWIAAVPDGSVLAVEADEPFFRDSAQEFSFPRLTLADAGHPADVVVRIVPGDGPQACGGYHVEQRA